MSLKAVHIVFIAASILLSAGMAAWCFARADQDASMGFWGGLSLIAAAVLAGYGRRVIAKLRGVGLL